MPPRDRPRHFVRFVALLAIVVGAGGCVTRTPASLSRDVTFQTPDAELLPWPQRSELGDSVRIIEGEEYGYLVDHGAFGHGHLLELRVNDDAPVGGNEKIVVGKPHWRNAQITFSLDYRRAPRHRDTEWMIFASALDMEMQYRNDDDEVVSFEIKEPRLSVVGAITPRERPLRGIAVLLSSLGGLTSGEKALIDALIEHGWAVGFVTPTLEAFRTSLMMMPRSAGIDNVGTMLAERVDQLLAERAYATQAIIEFLRTRRRAIPDGPIVLVGCSAGAVNTPTVAALLEDEVEAAVIVAGGADLYDIVQRSDLMRSMVQIEWNDGPLSAEERAALRTSTLERSALDPYHTAGALVNKPVLMLHAQFDRIVPASTGDRLYERLGRPERWVYPLGHLGLFWWLPTQAESIVNWIDRAVAPLPDPEEPNERP